MKRSLFPTSVQNGYYAIATGPQTYTYGGFLCLSQVSCQSQACPIILNES